MYKWGGYKSLVINPIDTSVSPIKALSVLFKFIYSLIVRIPNNSLVLLQYTSFRKSITVFIKLFRLKKLKLVFLIHDLRSLSQNGSLSEDEIEILNLADTLIVHTTQMKDLLERRGVKIPVEIISIFDYYVDTPLDYKEYKTERLNEIIFAGNLNKSKFIEDLFTKSPQYISYILYGVNTKYSEFPNFIKYKGKFRPDDVESISGAWGLIWDGTTCETCDGIKGSYLQYIAPHKTSLYIVAHKPIIIWSKAAMADFIKEHNIGITIDSLDELDEKISKIDRDSYNEMKKNISKISKQLESGFYLKNVLHKL